MMVMKFRVCLASDLGILISIIGIILSLIDMYVGNKKGKKRFFRFVPGITFVIISLLYVNYVDINRNYIKIPNIYGLTVDSAKIRLAENGVNINNVIFDFISNESLPEGETKVIEVKPACEEFVKKTSVINVSCEECIKKPEEDADIDFPSKELIVAINEQLSDEGMAVDEDDLKAFICMLNGDYEFINEDCLLRVLEAFMNLDIGTASALVGMEVTDNHMSSMSAIYGAFTREKDALFTEYWITRFEDLKSKIYYTEDMESVYHEIDEFVVDLYLAFCCSEPVLVDNEKISVRALREETIFFLQEVMFHYITQYLVDIHGINSQQYLEIEIPNFGEKGMISVGMIIEELDKSADNTRNHIWHKLRNYNNDEY